MTLPPQSSQQHELRRRIVGCRERLRQSRATHRMAARVGPAKRTESGEEKGEVHGLDAGGRRTRGEDEISGAKGEVKA